MAAVVTTAAEEEVRSVREEVDDGRSACWRRLFMFRVNTITTLCTSVTDTPTQTPTCWSISLGSALRSSVLQEICTIMTSTANTKDGS